MPSFVRFFSIACLITCLAGCADTLTQQKVTEAEQKAHQAMERCNKKALTPRNAVDRQDCLNQALINYHQALSYPYMWIISQQVAANRHAAIKYAEGKISRESYKTTIMQIQANAEQTERETSARERQERMQADMQAVQMWNILRPQPAQPYMIPVNRSVRTNCYDYGNNINCTTQ